MTLLMSINKDKLLRDCRPNLDLSWFYVVIVRLKAFSLTNIILIMRTLVQFIIVWIDSVLATEIYT